MQFYDLIIIGGGFFGCRIALYLKQFCEKILILENERELLQRASYINQARVHNGYHYPRSLLTALRSRVNCARFMEEYEDCIDNSFDKYYAIARLFSKVTKTQFKNFCNRIGAPLQPAKREVKVLFNKDLIEEVFHVQEFAFDAVKLKLALQEKLLREGIEVKKPAKAKRVQASKSNVLEVEYVSGDKTCAAKGRRVLNCTYSQINQLNSASKLPIVPLKHELTEMALLEVPSEIKKLGITVMDGPFFSIMPFPAKNLHSFSHVRYTPHMEWHDGDNCYRDAHEIFGSITKTSSYPSMIRDAKRYLPVLNDCIYRDSIWEVKTVLPQSEVDDSRPILFKKDLGLKNYSCVMGAKIDNIYDVLRELELSQESQEVG